MLPAAANRFERRPARTILALWIIGALVAGVAFESGYRLQVIDFYRPDLRQNNDPRTLESGRAWTRTVLALGDSFTAWPRSYPAMLAERLGPETRVVNSGVSGFTLRQIVRILPMRLAEFGPDTVILQVFGGNDLVELDHPLAWTRVSPPRNLFWLASNSWFESIGFLNHRMGSLAGAALRGLRGDPFDRDDSGSALGFSTSRYSEHERTLIAVEPDYVEQQLEVSSRYRSAYAEYLRLLGRSLDLMPAGGRRVVVLAVPHPLQVHDRYLGWHRSLGGVASSRRTSEPSTRFVEGIAGVVSSRRGIRFIDALDALRRQERQGQILFRATDLHLNVAGQQVLAELLLKEIGFAPAR